MVANLILGFLCVFALLLFENKELTLRYVFFALTTFLAIRYGWGNDYNGYLLGFKEIESSSVGLFDFDTMSGMRRNNEYGWIFLNKLFGNLHLGFFGLIIVISIFENYLIYRMITKYVENRYYWFAVLLYVFNTRLFAVGASMIRQYFCVCCFLYVAEIMCEKRKRHLLWSIIIILICSTIHRSTIVMLLTLPLFYIKIDVKRSSIKWSLVLLIAIIVWGQIAPNLFQNNILQLLESDESMAGYATYVGGTNEGNDTGLGVIFNYIMMIVWVFSVPSIDKNKQPLLLFFLTSYFVSSLVIVMPMINRYTLYCSFFSIVLWPWLLSKAQTKNGSFIYILLVMEIMIITKSYFFFYYNPIYYNFYYIYHTIFSAPSWM